MEKEIKEKEKKPSGKIELTQVATQTQPAFILPDGRVVGFEDAFVELFQMVLEVKKSVA